LFTKSPRSGATDRIHFIHSRSYSRVAIVFDCSHRRRSRKKQKRETSGSGALIVVVVYLTVLMALMPFY
jgi:hypothetical protein